MKIIFKYIKLAFKESPWLIMLGMLFIIVFRLLQFGMDLSLKFATDSILSATSYTGIILPFILFFCAMMLGGNTGNFNNFLITLYTKKTEKFFTKRFMERTYQEKQDSFYDATFYNKYAFVKNNIQETYQLTVTICSKLFSAIVSLIITATTISFLNPLLFLIVLVVSVLIVCINYFIINKRKKLAQTYTEEERRAAYYGDLLSNRNHAKELRIFHLQDFFLKRWKDSYGKYKKVYYSFDQKSMILQNIPGIVEQILAGVMIIFFLYETVTGSISVGDFVLLYRLMWRISWSIESIVSILSGDLLQNYTYIKEYDQFTKNNGKERTGVLIETPGVNISPTIYLEEYFQVYKQGETLETIVDEILAFYESIKQEKSWDYEKVMSYEGVRDRIVFKLVNTAKNRKILKSIPHIPFLDLSAVFYVLIEVTQEGSAAMMVNESHMEQWRVRTDTLWSDAVRNSRNLLPAEFFTMNYALKEMVRENAEYCTETLPENLLIGSGRSRDGMYVLSNKLRNYGAACIAYPHILEMIGGILRSDYYVLPSSVHEVVIVPCSEGLSAAELDEMVKNINATQVAEEEVLSDHVYLYDVKAGYLRRGTEFTSEGNK